MLEAAKANAIRSMTGGSTTAEELFVIKGRFLAIEDMEKQWRTLQKKD